MTYREMTGDLFAADLPAIGHGCNCVGSMRGGIAREFRRRFPEMHDEYRRRCKDGRFRLGDVFRWDAESLVVYNLATQHRSGADARLDAIRTSVQAALADAEASGLPALGLPRLGAGIGGLDWPDVQAVLHELAAGSPVELTVVSRPREPE